MTEGATWKHEGAHTTAGRVEQHQRDAASERTVLLSSALHQKTAINRYRFPSAPILHETTTTSPQESPDPEINWQQALMVRPVPRSVYTPAVPLAGRLSMEGADAEGSENAIW